MGYDATVRCRCFEEHRLNPGPVPYEDLYIDKDGYLWSHRLDALNARLRESDGQSAGDDPQADEQLELEFDQWLEHGACEHEYMEYANEHLGNIMAMATFRHAVREHEERYQLLRDSLPEGNGGQLDADDAPLVLAQLDSLVDQLQAGGYTEDYAFIVDQGTGQPVEHFHQAEHWYVNTTYSADTDIQSPYLLITHTTEYEFTASDGFNFPLDHVERWQSNHFRLHAADRERYDHGTNWQLTDLDTGSTIRADHALWDIDVPDACYKVQELPVPFEETSAHYTAMALRKVLQASIETGNPVLWC